MVSADCWEVPGFAVLASGVRPVGPGAGLFFELVLPSVFREVEDPELEAPGVAFWAAAACARLVAFSWSLFLFISWKACSAPGSLQSFQVWPSFLQWPHWWSLMSRGPPLGLRLAGPLPLRLPIPALVLVRPLLFPLAAFGPVYLTARGLSGRPPRPTVVHFP